MALDEGKGWAALIVGILTLALGAIPFLHRFNVISWDLPTFLQNAIGAFGIYIIAAIGFYLLIDAFMEFTHSTDKHITIAVALIVIAAGIISALHQFGVIGFAVPFLSYIVYNILFVIEGILLFIAAFAMK
ncbi:MAG: hypothetical protein ABIA93_05000 [Candidatus Woesearchaeota archaeon]